MAEKLEAIVSLGMLGSRMKDYFDVHFLITNHKIDKKRLKKAIRTTFSERNTPVEDFRYIFNDGFKKDKEKEQQWNAFLNRNFIESEKGFREIVKEIDNYITSILGK